MEIDVHQTKVRIMVIISSRTKKITIDKLTYPLI